MEDSRILNLKKPRRPASVTIRVAPRSVHAHTLFQVHRHDHRTIFQTDDVASGKLAPPAGGRRCETKGRHKYEIGLGGNNLVSVAQLSFVIHPPATDASVA